ncbi:unnamed protein product [Bursaphelenchus okinawaensis]|uniref:Uncharacterized protein n=1 Tax=Bursaphelenchus okinawaensis TaxID=465554 RepID=A0A811KJ80_9BILA|nr:unnamed protein product [Bursaphelenchus okinawaensis]CAG9104346.1 unnamed protein product [Bursaphelenchus okinawaensis]
MSIIHAKSSVCLPRERDIPREGVATLSRVTSVPNLANRHVDAKYAPSTLYGQRLDRTAWDDYYTDNFVHNPTVYWQDYRYTARRYPNTDPIPNSGEFGVPGFWSRYKFYTDYLNPQYWRKYRDPYYDRPLWDSWKPYLMDRYNSKKAIDMYRQGLISFDYLDKNWIEPTALARKDKDWGDTYTQAGRYGPRRYFYQFSH